MSGGLWTIINFVGPFLLLAVLVWAWASNRKRRGQGEARADAGAERLREQINAEDQRKGND
jgi:hypothetical protein